MTNFTLQVLAENDIELAQQLLALFQNAFDTKPAAPPSRKYLQRCLARPEFHAIVALQNDAVIGALTAYELELLNGTREMFLYDIAVAQEQRRQGVGRALMAHLESLCVARGIAACFVATEAEETEAIGFYGANGLHRQDVALFTREFDDASFDADL